MMLIPGLRGGGRKIVREERREDWRSLSILTHFQLVLRKYIT